MRLDVCDFTDKGMNYCDGCPVSMVYRGEIIHGCQLAVLKFVEIITDSEQARRKALRY